MSEEVRNGLMKQRRKAREKNKELQQENQQLKSVLNEVREYIGGFDLDYCSDAYESVFIETLDDIIKILEKVGGSNER